LNIDFVTERSGNLLKMCEADVSASREKKQDR
jgi:hypothetical protein